MEMITKKFLSSLKGKTVKQALSLCKKAGHETHVIDHGTVISLMLRPNTVILWKDEAGKKISNASSGEGVAL